MGSTGLRRILKQEQKWSDKEAKRHKHDFSLECNIELDNGEYLAYFHANKCLYCNSFIGIPKEGANNGYIKEPIPDLPIFKYKTSHKYAIGFSDLKFIS